MKVYIHKIISSIKSDQKIPIIALLGTIGIVVSVASAISPQHKPYAQSAQPQCSGSCLQNSCSSYNSPKIVSIQGTCIYGGYCCGQSGGGNSTTTIPSPT